MHKKLLVFSITILLALSFLTISPSISAESSWWDSNWQYSQKITIDHTKVVGDLSNFPYYYYNISSDFIDHAQDDGDDFVFMDNTNTTQYNHEIEHYDNATGELIAWVNITFLSSTVDTILYLYYGNPSCSNQENINGTWDSNYLGVYHFNELSGSTCYDSTSNSNDATYQGSLPTRTTGGVGYGQNLDGDGDYIDIPTLDIDHEGTFEVIINLDSYANSPSIFTISNDTSHHIYFVARMQDDYEFCSYQAPTFVWLMNVGTPDTSQHGISVGWKEDDVILFEDGIELGSDTSVSMIPFTVNEIAVGDSDAHTTKEVDGMMDEVRFSDIRRSNNHLITSYNSQSSPSTFAIYGSEQEQPIPNLSPDKPTCVSPSDAFINIPIDTTLKVHVVDNDNDTMSVSFYWSNDTLIETVTNIQNDTDAETSNLSLDYETTYNWYAIVNDSLLQNISYTFSFTTIPNTPPNKPINPTPVDNDINTSIYTTLKIHVIDTNDDNMSVSFYWSNDTLIETVTNIQNDTDAETSTLTLSRSMEYSWYAVANDSLLQNTSDTFNFTTTANSPDRPLCISPTDNEENVSINTTLKVHVIDITNDTMNVSFYWDNDSLIETINNVENDTDAESSNLTLDYATNYNWYATANDSITETTSFTFTFTTEPEPNYPPIKPTCILPVNNSIDVSITTTLKVHVIDMNNDNMTVSFYWENDTLIETISDSNNDTDVESLSLLLQSNTTYNWYAVANDSLLETQSETFNFTTGETATPICEHAIPRVESDGYLYMIYRDGNINVSNLNLLMGSYSPFTVCKFNYTLLAWDCEVITIKSNDYIRVKINQSDMPYNDTLISLTPQIRFKINDSDIDDKLNITVMSNSSGTWEIVKQWLNTSEGWYICNDSNMDEYNTTYYYSINVTDSYSNNLISNFSFITTSTEPAIPPITTTTDVYLYFGIIILMAIGGSMYILSGKKR